MGPPPNKLYWTLKSLPEESRVLFLNCLAGITPGGCSNLKEFVFARESQNYALVLMEWAKKPSVEMPAEELESILLRAREFDKKTQYYEKLMKSLCKKDAVKRAFRTCYFNTTGRRMRPIGDSGFADPELLVFGGARIVTEWDCGGWSHFREEIGVEWEGKMVMAQQSICSWLGYFPIGAGGWNWILNNDLEQAAHDAVQQTIQFRHILFNCVKKALEYV